MTFAFPSRLWCAAILLSLATSLWGTANVQAQDAELPVVYQTDFESGTEGWWFSEKDTWRLESGDESGKYLHQFRKEGTYQPPFRSPHHLALIEDLRVESFQLDVKVRSTHPDYGHRDCCLFFGFQDPAHFYYVHLGKATDDHANQIFIVNQAARTKISTKTTSGTPWDDEWHHVRICRDVETGEIAVYFDDMDTPVMKAVDKTFAWGQVGLGSFDDTSAWDDLKIRGSLKTDRGE